jgi:hypothetical protein
MPENSPIVACLTCGKKNRVRARSSGVSRCSVCHTLLPWIVEADRDTFEQELDRVREAPSAAHARLTRQLSRTPCSPRPAEKGLTYGVGGLATKSATSPPKLSGPQTPRDLSCTSGSESP